MKQRHKVFLEDVDISIVDSHIRLKEVSVEVSVICMKYLAKIYSDRADLYKIWKLMIRQQKYQLCIRITYHNLFRRIRFQFQ
jgi:hypothetical protein